MDPAKDANEEQQEEERDVRRAADVTRQPQDDGDLAEDGGDDDGGDDGGSDDDDGGSNGDGGGSDGDDDDEDEEADDGDAGGDEGYAGETSTAAVGKDVQPHRLCDPDMAGESRTLEESRRGVGVESLHLGESRTLEESRRGVGVESLHLGESRTLEESRRGVGVESLHLGESRTLEESPRGVGVESLHLGESRTLEEAGRGLGERQAGGESAVRSHRRVESLNLEEEWQDEDFPSPISLLGPEPHGVLEVQEEGRPAVPSSLPPSSAPRPSRRKLTAPDISLSLDRADEDDEDDDDESDIPDIDVDALETPDDAESLDATGPTGDLEWEDDTPLRRAPLPELSGAEEREEALGWRHVLLGDTEHRVDLRAVEPYKRVLSHGGYYGDGLNAIIVFAACYLPDGKDPEYAYIMENLFLYMVSTLDRLVAEDYMIVYLNGATPRRRTPGLGWLKRCYTMIDRRLRKNLKALVIVHPSFFVRTLLALTRPFISSKFSRKVRYVHSLAELAEVIPMEHVSIPDCIQQEELDMQRRRHESDNTPWYT